MRLVGTGKSFDLLHCNCRYIFGSSNSVLFSMHTMELYLDGSSTIGWKVERTRERSKTRTIIKPRPGVIGGRKIRVG